MSHELDDDLIVPPDRRPLVYGGAAMVILLVAAFLFWPRGEEGPNPMAQNDLMPDQVTQASDESVSTDTEPLAADMGAAGTMGGVVDDVAPAETGTAGNPVEESRIVEDEAPPATPTPARPRETQPERTSPSRVRDNGTAQPGATGTWVLNVGSFSSRANADRRAEELNRQGIQAHVSQGTGGNGQSVYRVRVGYFGSSADAKTYGNWLKSSQQMDSWASKR